MTSAVVRRRPLGDRAQRPAATLVIAGVVGAAVVGLTYAAGYERSAIVAFAVLSAAAAAGFRSIGAIRAAPRVAEDRGTPRRVLLAVVAVVAIVLLCSSVALVIAPGAFDFDPQRTTQYRPGAVAGLVVIGIGCLLWVRARTDQGRRLPVAVGRVMLAILVVGCLAVQVRVAFAVTQYSTYDSVQIFSAAYNHVVDASPALFSADVRAQYFSMLPNNALLAAAFSWLFTALHAVGLSGVHNYLWASVITTCISLDVAVLLTLAVARRLITGISFVVTAAFAVLFLVLSPWLATPYSDTLGAAFPIGILALHLWCRPTSRLGRAGLWAVTGVALGVGYAIKPTVVFVVLAILAVQVFSAARDRRALLDVAGAAVVLAAAFLGTHVAVLAAIDASGVLPFSVRTNHGSLPFTHFLAMGTQGAGGYRQADVDASLALPDAQRSAASLTLFLQRISAFGPIGYLLFLGQKTLYTFSDGTFFQGREGVGPYDQSYFLADPLSQKVQSVFAQAAPEHWIASSVWQAGWLLVLVLCLVPVARRLRRDDRMQLAVIRLSIALLVMFLLFSESRSRYLYVYVPFFLLLAGLGGQALTDVLARAGSRLTRIVAPVHRPSANGASV